MPFEIKWATTAEDTFRELEIAADKAKQKRATKRKTKSSKQEGLFNQIVKTLQLLKNDPKHPGLCCHEYSGLDHPHNPREKAWEAYAQNKTLGAYRVFWCYGPGRGYLTIIAIAPHP